MKRSLGTRRNAALTAGDFTYSHSRSLWTSPCRSLSQSVAIIEDTPRGYLNARHGSAARAAVAMTRVTRVTGRPARTQSRNEISTPFRVAAWTMITFAAAPRIVAFPASVELAARVSHRVRWLATGAARTTGSRSRTAGTFETRFDRTDVSPESHQTPLPFPPLTNVNVPWIEARTPDRSTPAMTMKSPMKKRRMDQSTAPMRVRPVAFRLTTGRPNRTRLPPVSAITGSQAGALRKNAATDPRRTARVNARPGRWMGATVVSGGRAAIGFASRPRNAKATMTIEIARHTAVIGAITSAYSVKGIPLRIPMYAFCGFPISVATDPTFTAIPSPTRKGTGSSSIAWHACTTIGVIRRAIVSFSTTALRTAATTMRRSE